MAKTHGFVSFIMEYFSTILIQNNFFRPFFKLERPLFKFLIAHLICQSTQSIDKRQTIDNLCRHMLP